MSISIKLHQNLGLASAWPTGTINSTAGGEVFELLLSANAARRGVNSAGAPHQDSGGEIAELDTVISDCKARLIALSWKEPSGDPTAG